MSILRWDKPSRAVSVEEWKSRQADGAPPGTYIPNMSDEDASTWRAEIKGKTTENPVVEIRRSLGMQLLVRVARYGTFRDKYGYTYDGDIAISMNATCYMSFAEWQELHQCINEAREALSALPERG